MPNLHIQLLGDMALSDNDKLITSITSPRLQSFLAYLLLHRDALHPRQELAYLFWPESNESQARTNLRKLLYELRRALPNVDQFLYDDNQTIGWCRDADFTLDVDEFEEAIAQAKTIEALKKAVALYHGDLLPNCYDDWILDDRQRVLQLHMEALERLVTELEDARDYRSAIQYAQRLLNHAPLQENYYRMMMRLQALNGNRAHTNQLVIVS